MEVLITSVPLKAVDRFIFKWLEIKGFAIISLDSPGSPVVWGYYGARVKLSPRAGYVICIHYKATGAVALEYRTQQVNDDVLVVGEFYAAGASIFGGREWDVRPKVKLMGRFPRRRGYKLMKDLERRLVSLSS